jgi:hypothetical protein
MGEESAHLRASMSRPLKVLYESQHASDPSNHRPRNSSSNARYLAVRSFSLSFCTCSALSCRAMSLLTSSSALFSTHRAHSTSPSVLLFSAFNLSSSSSRAAHSAVFSPSCLFSSLACPFSASFSSMILDKSQKMGPRYFRGEFSCVHWSKPAQTRSFRCWFRIQRTHLSRYCSHPEDSTMRGTLLEHEWSSPAWLQFLEQTHQGTAASHSLAAAPVCVEQQARVQSHTYFTNMQEFERSAPFIRTAYIPSPDRKASTLSSTATENKDYPI